jgi:DNA-binding NarL/FixJ family response regulator
MSGAREAQGRQASRKQCKPDAERKRDSAQPQERAAIKKMKKPTVLLADDHVVFAEGLRKILEPEFEVVDSVRDGRTMVSEVLRLKPDVILADIAMPLLNGIDAARQIRKTEPRAKIIFLTMHSDPIYAAEALDAGASGYLVKQSAAREVVTAIRTVLRGRTYVTPLVARGALEPLRGSGRRDKRKAYKLTHRQREVLQLVAEGRSAKEIARILNVSHRTIEFHKHRIMEELGIHTVAEMTRFAIEHRVLAL